MTCEECQKAEANLHHGVYQLTCVQCCARLVVSARPHKAHQESMLAVIARTRGTPPRQLVLDCIKAAYSNNNQQQPAQRSLI